MTFSPNNSPVFPHQPQAQRANILNAGSTAFAAIYTPGTNGTKVFGVLAASNDSVAHSVALGIQNSSTVYTLGVISVPAGSGFNAGTPSVNMLGTAGIGGLPVDSDGNSFFYLGASDTLVAAPGTVVTSGSTLTVQVFAADF